jgi:hypothetical protein
MNLGAINMHSPTVFVKRMPLWPQLLLYSLQTILAPSGAFRKKD